MRAPGSGLRVIDISTPSNPSEVGYCDTPDDALGIVISGAYAYVADNNAGLQIYENLLAGVDEKGKDKEKVLKVTQNLFMGTAEVQVYGVNLPVTLNLCDITGRVRETAIIYNSSPVTIGFDLKSGIYFLRVEGFEPAKIVKLR